MNEEIKKEARELVVRYYSLLSGLDIEYINQYSHSLLSENSTDSYFTLAKQCAIIAVDVILNKCGAKDWGGDVACDGRNYWQEVKQAIEQL